MAQRANRSFHRTAAPPAEFQTKPGVKQSQGSGLEFILFQCGKLRPEQIYCPRFHLFPSIKSASSPGKSCARSYEINSNIHIGSSHHYDQTNRSSLAITHCFWHCHVSLCPSCALPLAAITNLCVALVAPT